MDLPTWRIGKKWRRLCDELGLADLIVLDRDIYETPAHQRGATQVSMTLLDGEPVHQSEDL